MSVYKSRRKDASAQFIADARELRRMTARAVKRFPSSYRYIVTNGLLEMAREIVVNAVKGNAVYLHKDLSQGDFDLRHRYLKMAEVTADAYLEEITFAFSLVDDGNSFFKKQGRIPEGLQRPHVPGQHRPEAAAEGDRLGQGSLAAVPEGKGRGHAEAPTQGHRRRAAHAAPAALATQRINPH